MIKVDHRIYPHSVDSPKAATQALDAQLRRNILGYTRQIHVDALPVKRHLYEHDNLPSSGSLPKRPGRFLVLGSSSPDLLRQSSGTLAGRLSHVFVTPFHLWELRKADANLQRWDKFLWRRGFPDSYLASDDQQSFRWRENYIQTFVERDLRQFGVDLNPQHMRRCTRWNIAGSPTVNRSQQVMTNRVTVLIQTWYRLHIAVDLVKLHLIHVKVTDKHEGEHPDHFLLQEGDVVLIDRGCNQPGKLIEQVDKGVSVVLRYNPHGMNVYDRDGEKIDLYDQLHGTAGTSLCIPVRVYAEGLVTIRINLHNLY